LKEMSCDVAQGYLIAKPMDCTAFFEFCDQYPYLRGEPTSVASHDRLSA